MKKYLAFTLAEIIVVLTLLGTVAAITIPSALNNVSKKSNVTKIKKAYAMYDKFIQSFIVINNIKTLKDLKYLASHDGTAIATTPVRKNYATTTEYTQARNEYNNGNCENIHKDFKIKKNT